MQPEINTARMTAGEIAYRSVVDSMGFDLKWEDLPTDRQLVWEQATENWLASQCRTSGFCQFLQSEMAILLRGEYVASEHSVPIRLSNAFLVTKFAKAQQDFENYKEEAEKDRSDAARYRNSQNADDSTLLTMDWITKQVGLDFSHLDNGGRIDFEFNVNSTITVYLIGRVDDWQSRTPICELSDRKDFRQFCKMMKIEYGIYDDE